MRGDHRLLLFSSPLSARWKHRVVELVEHHEPCAIGSYGSPDLKISFECTKEMRTVYRHQIEQHAIVGDCILDGEHPARQLGPDRFVDATKLLVFNGIAVLDRHDD